MFTLFGITYGMNDGYVGFFGLELLELPSALYSNLVTTFFGFPDPWFWSSDYFSLFPWTFLYFTGYFVYRLWKAEQIPGANCLNRKIPLLTWMGKHSLIIYMIHQPIIFGVLELVFSS